jgi:hypothetical protein
MTAAPRLLFVGLDAASPDLIEPWINAGLLPTLARSAERSVAIEDFAPTMAALLGCSFADVDGAPVPALLGR